MERSSATPHTIYYIICYNNIMGEFKTKLRQSHYRLKHEIFVFDNIVLFLALVLCLAFTWGAISSMSRNWTLAQEVINRQRSKALLELEVETLELENTYYLSEEYQELAARKYQGKMLPGETMIYLPENSVAAKTKHGDTPSGEVANLDEPMSNFEQWMTFLFGI